jgi:peptidoglycan/xylan/chitin deacetylase (PgdA/CDA1 family)
MMERDFRGYRNCPPNVKWPNDSSVAVSIVVNVEEGAELSLVDGDERNESVYEIREEVVGSPDLCMASHFAYGTRAGYWRILEVFSDFGIPATFSCCGRVAGRSGWLVQDAVENGHEVSCHGWRWEAQAGMDEKYEREVISRTYAKIAQQSVTPPVGWHTRSASSPNTRRLLMEHGGFLYDSDAYDDDIPYIIENNGQTHVVLPYAFDTNDMRFQPGGGFVHGDDFSRYCLAAYDQLLEEGRKFPRMLSIGVHLRIIGRAGRIAALQNLIDGINQRGGHWFAPRRSIAEYWRAAIGLPLWRAKYQRL